MLDEQQLNEMYEMINNNNDEIYMLANLYGVTVKELKTAIKNYFIEREITKKYKS